MKLRDVVTQEDVRAIVRMVRECGVFSQEEIQVAEELAQDAATLGDASHYRFLLAEKAGQVAGYSCFGRIPLTEERYDLYWLVTSPALQRAGVASVLMRATAEAVRVRGGNRMYAETSSRDCYLPAQRFYEVQGFTLVAQVSDFYRDGDDKLLYALML